MNRTPIIVSWSGGKDSSLALAALRADSQFQITGLLTSITVDYDRISIHGVRRSLLEAQAKTLDLPLYEVLVEANATNASYEAAFHTALATLRRKEPHARHIAFGDLFLADVRNYRETLLSATEYEAVFPLWGMDTTQLARHFIDAGFVAHLVCVDTSQLDVAFAGRRFDLNLLADLPQDVDPCGERGEFHTFVSAGPILAEPIACHRGEIVIRDNRFAYCDLLPGHGNETLSPAVQKV